MATVKPPGTHPLIQYGLPIGAEMLKGLGSYLGGAGDRRFQEQARRQLPHLQREMKEGITEQDILRAGPMIQRGVMPMVNRMGTKAAAKYGSRSGATAGAMMSRFNEAMVPQMSRLYDLMLRNNQQNLRQLHGETARVAGI